MSLRDEKARHDAYERDLRQRKGVYRHAVSEKDIQAFLQACLEGMDGPTGSHEGGRREKEPSSCPLNLIGGP